VHFSTAWWGAATSNLRGGGGKQADAKNLRYVLQTVLSFRSASACIIRFQLRLRLAVVGGSRPHKFCGRQYGFVNGPVQD
jgi:hypothetical protein